MSRLFFAMAYVLGAATVVWMGKPFVGSDVMALTVIVLIGSVYTLGWIELLRFRQATSTLSRALALLPGTESVEISSLGHWLNTLHPSLHNAVRLRIEGERVGLPAPIITPYLVGLLVMLGLLGTFLGMVDTLQGAVIALEGSTELEAIRAGLAAPIRGLGLAFGTSVAGVAASAMLGLMSTVSRRDRMLATEQLDTKIATVFRQFSLVYQRQETFKALQAQAHALPEVAERLHALAGQMERMGDNLGNKLVANQEMFHQSVKSVYTDLASSVAQSLQDSLGDSGRQAGEGIKPVVQELVGEIRSATHKTHQHLTHAVQEQLEALTGSFRQTSQEVSAAWQSGLAAHQLSNDTLMSGMTASFEVFSGQFQRATESMSTHLATEWQRAGEQSVSRHQEISDSLEQTVRAMTDHSQATATDLLGEMTGLLKSSEDLVHTRIASEESWLTGHGERMDDLTMALRTELESLRTEEERRGRDAVERLAELEATVAAHLATLGKELEQPMTRLIQTASETPRAAAEVIGQLRREISNTIERDNSLLEERQRTMEQLSNLSNSLEQATTRQFEVIETLVNSSTDMLSDVGSRFAQQVGSQMSKMSEVADNFAGSAIEMSSLGEAFTLAINLFNESNQNLITKLNRIEAALEKSSSRSDEQLGYYVAQAREMIDHSMSSQQGIFDELRQLGRQGRVATAEAS